MMESPVGLGWRGFLLREEEWCFIGVRMKQIALSRGMVALVDDEDFKWLVAQKWHVVPSGNGRNYATRRMGGRTTYMHRVILERVTGAPLGKLVVDHINGDALDNRRSNLRAVTNSENLRNAIRRCTNKSGYVGVVWHTQTKKWNARIKVNYKAISLGLYDNKEDANAARLKAEKELWGIQPRRVEAHK